MLLDLQEQWQAVTGPHLENDDFIDEDVFFGALNKIFNLYSKSSLVPAPAVSTLIEYCRANVEPLAMFFTGRTFCKGLAAFVKPAMIDAAWKSVVQGYFTKASESQFMFDEIERQVVKSSLTAGAVLINVENEVWFF